MSVQTPILSLGTRVLFLDSTFTITRIWQEEGRVRVELRGEGRTIVVDGSVLERFV